MNRDKELTRNYIRDLVVDIRCAVRDGLPDYAEKCRAELRHLYNRRHSTRIGKWGIPKV